MTRYTLTVPLQLNDGTPTPDEELARIADELLDIAGGFTATDGTGTWRGDDRIYVEPVRVFTIDLADPADLARPWLHSVAAEVAHRLDQEAVYVTEQAIDTALVTAPTAVTR